MPPEPHGPATGRRSAGPEQTLDRRTRCLAPAPEGRYRRDPKFAIFGAAVIQIDPAGLEGRRLADGLVTLEGKDVHGRPEQDHRSEAEVLGGIGIQLEAADALSRSPARHIGVHVLALRQLPQALHLSAAQHRGVEGQVRRRWRESMSVRGDLATPRRISGLRPRRRNPESS